MRLAMLGMIEGNAHPYSWSAIINGYDPAAMAQAVGTRYPVIVDYLGAEPADSIGVEGAVVSHVWTEDPREARQIARASRIEHVVTQPEAVIGEVDAVIISTDDGDDHVRRAHPFIEAGLPIFIDKPLATNPDDLRQFVVWQKAGHPILSSSGMRYSPKIAALKQDHSHLGELRWITSTTGKTWERYGIHALECVYPLLGPGIETVSLHSGPKGEVATIGHCTGTQISVAILPNAGGCSGVVHIHGNDGHTVVENHGTYVCFRNQLVAFVHMLHNDCTPPFPFTETVELMATLIAGIDSRQNGGRKVEVAPIIARAMNL